ncbi:hypothetical protein JW992_07765 [candidate division KSB1 bacterium]|nr:hypothetical protein [candidate division KSB1 bacterium]
MTKRIGIVISLLAILSTSCEKRLFSFVADIDQIQTYQIDQTGAFEIGRVVSRSDVLAILDIPQDAYVTDVKIQTIAVSVTIKEGNQASHVKLTATVNDLLSGKEQVFRDYPVPLTGKLGIANPWSPVTLLLDRGINKVKNKIAGYVKNNDPFDYELILEGDSDPVSQRVVADIRLKIVATVEYDACIEVFSVFSGGKECPDAKNALGP